MYNRDQLEGKTVKKLRAITTRMNIRNRSKARRKMDLVELILSNNGREITYGRIIQVLNNGDSSEKSRELLVEQLGPFHTWEKEMGVMESIGLVNENGDNVVFTYRYSLRDFPYLGNEARVEIMYHLLPEIRKYKSVREY
jgi:hypothetical protein